jgi:hypothetical protein
LEAATAASLRLGPGFVYVQGSAVEICSVQGLDRLIGLGRVAHFYEGKAAGSAGIAIRYQIHPIHPAILFEHCTDARFSRSEIQVADKDVFQFLLLSF